jgi:ABC-type glycerol-3-phosphate transport system substrate-binding protein
LAAITLCLDVEKFSSARRVFLQMFKKLIFLVKLCVAADQFIGNRTHYSNLKPREGSVGADLTFQNSGKGAVIMSFTDQKFVPNHSLRGFQNSTAKKLDLSLTFSPELVRDCAFVGDILIMDVIEVGKYEDCLLDVYAWDFNFASAIDPRVVQNGVSKDRLIALPLEYYKTVLVYNKDILSRNGYTSFPNDLASFTEMIDSIQVNERGAENFIKGFALPLADKQVLVSWIAELTTGVGGFVFKDRFNSIATGNFSNTLDVVISWLKGSIFDAEDFNRNWDEVLEIFIDQKVIFIHADPLLILNIDASFSWDLTSLPGLTMTYPVDGKPFTRQGVSSGTVMGSFIGVNKNSQNPSGALKLVQTMTSVSYQRALISNDTYQRGFLVPFHDSLINDEEFCDTFGSKCKAISVPAIRPSTISGSLYPNTTDIIYSGILSIFNGAVDVGNGIEDIDDKLRILLKFPARNTTLTDGDKVRTKASKFKNLLEQVLLLLLFVGIGVSVALLYKRKIEAEEKEKSAGVPMQDLSENARLVSNMDRS